MTDRQPDLALRARLRLAAATLLASAAGACAVPRQACATDAVDCSELVDVGDARVFLLTRGVDRAAPLLLWLHGGPGGAERPLFRHFNGALEERFVVAYLDQRGAGRSYDAGADPRRLTIARHLADLDVVIDHLAHRFGRDKVILVGHSWGAALGMLYAQSHPGKVATLIGVAPLVSTLGAQQRQHDFVLGEACRRDDADAMAQLAAIGPPPHETANQVLGIETLADRYGAVFHTRPDRVGLVISGVLSGLVMPWEIPGFIRANRVSLDAMGKELLGLDLGRSVPAVDVPVVFFLGRFDRHVDACLAAAYFEVLRAPVKRLVWFERSAHNVPFEEPERFNAALSAAVQSVLPGRHAR